MNYYLMNCVTVGARRLWPGTVIDDLQVDARKVVDAGGLLVPASAPGMADAAAAATAIKVRGGSIDEATAVMAGAYVQRHDKVVAATASCIVVRMPAQCSWAAPAAASATALVNAAPVVDGELVVSASPSPYPRRLQVSVVDADSSITGGTLVLEVQHPDGLVAEHAVALQGGSRTIDGVAVGWLQSARIVDVAGADVANTVSIGFDGVLPLPVPSSASNVRLLMYTEDGAIEPPPEVDQASASFVPLTAPDGAVNFEAWFAYDLTIAQEPHSHALA